MKRAAAETRRPFLTATWRDLLLVTWKVPDEALRPHLPPGVELDRHEGSALASLVAFDFLEARVWGRRWPWLHSFPELNLRFYIRAGGRRGVCFIREYVPSRIVAACARWLYNEPYRRVPYRSHGAHHVLRVAGRTHRIRWERSGAPYVPAEGDLAHFLKEHELGVGTRRDGTPLGYRVRHPVWRVWPRVEVELDADLALLYGSRWAFLGDTPPISTLLAEGSKVEVFGAVPLAELP